MTFTETFSAGMDSIKKTASNLTAPGELNARGAADLITSIEAIKQGDTDVKLTRAEIKALSEINASKVAEMKRLFDTEATAKYAHENSEEEKARKAYWESFKSKLDAVIASYQRGLDTIKIGTQEDLDSLKKAHNAMLALKGGAAGQQRTPEAGTATAEVRKTPEEILNTLVCLRDFNSIGLEGVITKEGRIQLNKGAAFSKNNTYELFNITTNQGGGQVETKQPFDISKQNILFHKDTSDLRLTKVGSSIQIEEYISKDGKNTLIGRIVVSPIQPITPEPVAQTATSAETIVAKPGGTTKPGSVAAKPSSSPKAPTKPASVKSEPHATATDSVASKKGGTPVEKPDSKKSTTSVEKPTSKSESETKALLGKVEALPKDPSIKEALEKAKSTGNKADLMALTEKLGITLDKKTTQKNLVEALNTSIRNSNAAIDAKKQQDQVDQKEFQDREEVVLKKLGKKGETGAYKVVDKSITFNNSTYYKLIDNQWNFSYRSNPDYRINKHVSWMPVTEAFDQDGELKPKTGYNISKSEPLLRELLELNTTSKNKGYALRGETTPAVTPTTPTSAPATTGTNVPKVSPGVTVSGTTNDIPLYSQDLEARRVAKEAAAVRNREVQEVLIRTRTENPNLNYTPVDKMA